MVEHYDRNGKPMTFEEWMKACTSENRRVAIDKIDFVEVSTVWLGLDHGFGVRRHIFETMIFGGDRDQECFRYATEAEAIEGHNRVCEELRREHKEETP